MNESLNLITFYLTSAIHKELFSTYDWTKRIAYKKQKPVCVTLSLNLLYHKGFLIHQYGQRVRITTNPAGLDGLLTEDQAMLLIHSSNLIGLPELTYLAAALHQENKQNKL